MGKLLQTTIESLGWALSHAVWQCALLWILFSVCQSVLAKGSARSRHINAVFWLLLMLALPVWGFIRGLTTVNLLGGQASASLLGSPVESALYTHQDGLLIWTQCLPVVVALWMATVALLVSRLGIGWWKTAKLRTQGCTPLPELQSVVESISLTIGVAVPVRIFKSVQVLVPTLVGWIKPVILLPGCALLGLTRRELELIIAHELAHVRRLDNLSNYLLIAAETLLFFHPAVHSVTRAVRHERELCCDDLVVECCGDSLQYAKALAKLESFRGAAVTLHGPLELAATDGPLLLRIRRLFDNGVRTTPTTSYSAMFAALAVLAVTAFLDDLSEKMWKPVIAATVQIDSSNLAVDSHKSDSHAHVNEVTLPTPDYALNGEPLEASLDYVEDLLLERKARAQEAQKFRQLQAIRQAFLDELKTSAYVDNTLPVLNASLQDAVYLNSALQSPSLIQAGQVEGAADTAHKGSADNFNALATPLARPGPMPEFGIAAGTKTMEADLEEQFYKFSNYFGSEEHFRQQVEQQIERGFRVTRASYRDESNLSDTWQPVETGRLVEGISFETAVTGGSLIHRVEPNYPRGALIRGLVENVQVELTIDSAGKVSHVDVLSRDARPMFKRSVIRAVTQWQFEPLVKNGEPVEQTLQQSFDFRLT